jgi:hypothetical protein
MEKVIWNISGDIIIIVIIIMVLQPFVGPWPLFSYLILYTVGSTPWTGDQPVSDN